MQKGTKNDDVSRIIVRLRAVAEKAEETGRNISAGFFLDANAMEQLERAVSSLPGVTLKKDGGYPDAERAVPVFAVYDEEKTVTECVKFRWPSRSAAPGHRDVLGALMSLGIDRKCFGDIVFAGDEGYIFMLPEVSSYVLMNLDKAGGTPLSLERAEAPSGGFSSAGEEITIHVKSPRLDAVMAACWGFQRQNIKNVIDSGLVSINWRECFKAEAPVHTGDTVTWRGRGRLRVTGEFEVSRKGRLRMTVVKYGG